MALLFFSVLAIIGFIQFIAFVKAPTKPSGIPSDALLFGRRITVAWAYIAAWAAAAFGGLLMFAREAGYNPVRIAVSVSLVAPMILSGMGAFFLQNGDPDLRFRRVIRVSTVILIAVCVIVSIVIALGLFFPAAFARR
mgnify:CR=1 FL=1